MAQAKKGPKEVPIDAILKHEGITQNLHKDINGLRTELATIHNTVAFKDGMDKKIMDTYRQEIKIQKERYEIILQETQQELQRENFGLQLVCQSYLEMTPEAFMLLALDLVAFTWGS